MLLNGVRKEVWELVSCAQTPLPAMRTRRLRALLRPHGSARSLASVHCEFDFMRPLASAMHTS